MSVNNYRHRTTGSMIILYTERKFSLLADSWVRYYTLRRRSLHKGTTCDFQFITGYMTIPYGTGKYGQYDANYIMHMSCSEKVYESRNLKVHS